MIEMMISGLSNLYNIFDSVEKSTDSKELYKEAAETAKQYAEENCPYDTGTLMETIYVEVQDDGFIIGAYAPYAVYNEYGSIYTPAGTVMAPRPAKYSGFRPFLRPAVYRVREEFGETFGRNLIRLTAQGASL